MDSTMKPVVVRLYGLIPITKRYYIVTMLLCLVTVALSVGWARYKLDLPFPWEDTPMPAALAKHWLGRNFYWLVLGGLLFGLVDSILAFRLFAKAEGQQPLNPSPPPSNP
jgi:hypothetical protein